AWIAAGAPGPSGAAVDPSVLITPDIKPTAAPRKPISAVAWSPDGAQVALSGYEGVRLVDAKSWETVRELAGQRGNLNAIAFSRDGKTLVGAAGQPGLFGEAVLWTLESKDAPANAPRRITGHRDALYAAVLSPAGKLLATCSYDEKIKFWDLGNGMEVRTLEGHNGAVYDMAFNHDGRLLATASGDRTVKLWDVATGNRLDTFGQPLKEVYTVAFSPDGSRVAAAGADNRIRLWQISATAMEGTNPLLESRFAHQGAIVKLVWSPDGQLLASSAEDGSLKLWDAKTVAERLALPKQTDWTGALAFSPDSQKLLVGRLDGTFSVYSASDGGEIGTKMAKLVPSTTFNVVLLADDKQPPPKPELSALEPRGAQRGATTRIRVRGKNLKDASEVRSSHAGLAAKLIADDASPESLWVEVSAAKDAPDGPHEVSVVAPGGESGKLKLYVDDLPQSFEQEPGTPDAPQALALPSGVWGAVSRAGDVDVFAIDLAEGQTVVVEVSANSLASKLNGVLAVVDDMGKLLAGSNDFDGGPDPLVAFTAKKAGRYRVEVGDLQMAGSGEHFYRLSIGSFPYVVGCYPTSVPANQESHVELAGFNLPAGAKGIVKAGGPGEAAVELPAGFRARRGFNVLVNEQPDVLENEPNDAPAQATAITIPGAASGRIAVLTNSPAAASAGAVSASADVDLFRFTAKKGEPWIIETQAASRSSPVDTRIEVLDSAGQPVPRLLLQATRDSYIEFRGIDSRTPDVRVANWEEMDLNEFLYLQGEVCKLFRAPQGPDSGFVFYSVGGQRRCYFDTSGSTHALGEPVYIVRPKPADEPVAASGLPIFTLHYANDDDGDRQLASDSKLTFTAPADGEYLVRVGDARGHQGDHYAYRLIVRQPKPDFQVTVAGTNPAVPAGSGKEITFNVTRRDGFAGEIAIDVSGLPAGFSLSGPIVVEAGHTSARAALLANADAAAPSDDDGRKSKVVVRATIDGVPVVYDAGSLGQIKLAEKPKLLVRLEPAELEIRPGTTVTALLKIERNDFNDPVKLDVNNLPHGIIVDNIGLNGVLIPPGQTERQIFITSRPWVSAMSRPFHAVSAEAGNQASPGVMLHVKSKER
ncbi:MAG: pre-peptidase C-terminal domain-containing protein, partial [Planctomycetia bacterium]|nr:pre-peptidase C-terminal domain-containing protein [Planctomycetia bacterium]